MLAEGLEDSLQLPRAWEGRAMAKQAFWLLLLLAALVLVSLGATA